MTNGEHTKSCCKGKGPMCAVVSPGRCAVCFECLSTRKSELRELDARLPLGDKVVDL